MCKLKINVFFLIIKLFRTQSCNKLDKQFIIFTLFISFYISIKTTQFFKLFKLQLYGKSIFQESLYCNCIIFFGFLKTNREISTAGGEVL